jgi:hypothetical protein
MQFSQNVVRVNVPVDDRKKEDVLAKRRECLKLINDEFAACKEGTFAIHEGYREIFIELKAHKRTFIAQLLNLVRKYRLQVNTFVAYLGWQRERVRRELTYSTKKPRDSDSKSESHGARR